MKIALVCIAKNEDKYIDEWIDYHLSLGVTDVFVYQNNWRYSGGFIDDSRVKLVEFDGDCKQLPCYNDFITNRSDGYDFGMFFDVDEYLSIRNGSLEDLLRRHVDNVAIGVNWRFFGDSGRKDVADGDYSLLSRFTKCGRSLNKHIKTILNFRRMPNGLMFVNPHFVNAYTVSIDMKYAFTGPFLERDEDDDSLGIQLNHYYVKTPVEFWVVKCNRGRPDFSSDSSNQYLANLDETRKAFDEANVNDIVDTTARDFYESVKNGRNNDKNT